MGAVSGCPTPTTADGSEISLFHATGYRESRQLHRRATSGVQLKAAGFALDYFAESGILP